jgi:hypothetical protein
MFLPAPRYIHDVCSPACRLFARAGVAVGSDPADTGPQQNTGSNNPISSPGSNRPGPHRFIGVGMVAGLAFIVLLLWLTCGSWPRRIAAHYGCLRQRRKTSFAGESEAKLNTQPMDDIAVPRPEKAKTREAKTLGTSRQFVQPAGIIETHGKPSGKRRRDQKMEWEQQDNAYSRVRAPSELLDRA